MSSAAENEEQQQIRLKVNQRLIESGEKEQLKELIRSKLIECGWKDKVKNHTKDLINQKAADTVSVEELVAEVTPFARSAVPESIRNELVGRIENPYLLLAGEEYLSDFACMFEGIKCRLKLCTKSIFFEQEKSKTAAIKRIALESITSITAVGDKGISIKLTKYQVIDNYKYDPVVTGNDNAEIRIMLLVTKATDLINDIKLLLNKSNIEDLKQKYAIVPIIDLQLQQEQILFDKNIKLLIPLINVPGRLILTSKRLVFQAAQDIFDSEKKRIYDINSIVNVFMRRHTLLDVGMEIYFNKNSSKLDSLFLVFNSEDERQEFFKLLLIHKPPGSLYTSDANDMSRQLENVKQKWLKREISNYEYLIQLNFLSGRTRNDLSQYPVFPWVLSDYTSSTLDLKDERIYRDLSKPIGALNNNRLIVILDRYKEMILTNSPYKFMYGTHYSTPAYVSYYLVRMYPEYMLNLHNGKFDTADRLFFSIESTWKGVTGNLVSDVKELIPEFYEVPIDGERNFLTNFKQMNLGQRQNGNKVSDVILPPWASSAKDFHEKMRDALESEYVSQRLHHWIDLIWGYKQKGKEAEKANNLFHPICMYGGEFLESLLTGDVKYKEFGFEKDSLEVQIREFGQIPKQLFKGPHPKRLPASVGIPASTYKVRKNNNLTVDASTLAVVFSKEKYSPIKKEVFEHSPIHTNNESTLKLMSQIKLHRSSISGLGIVKDGKDNYNIYASSKDGLLKLYSSRLDIPTRTFNVSSLNVPAIAAFEFNDKTMLFLGGWDNKAYKYINSSTAFEEFLCCEDAVSKIIKVDNLMVVSSWDSEIRIFSVTSDVLRYLYSVECDEGVLTVDSKKQDCTLFIVAVTKAATYLFKEKDLLWKKGLEGKVVNDVKFMENGRIAIIYLNNSQEKQSTLKILRQDDAVELFSFNISMSNVLCILDNKTVLTGDFDGSLRCWSLELKRQIRYYDCFETVITTIVIYEDLLVCGSSNGSISQFKIINK